MILYEKNDNVSHTVMSCSELAKMENEYQQDLRERGRECRYNYKGELQHCGYIN